jgi:Xaa-Pro aminopeptidase
MFKHGFAQFFGGTSLLILVGVVLDTLQQIESHLLMRHYDGLLNSGRVHGNQVVFLLIKYFLVMKIFLKTEDEIELMYKANQLVGKTLGELAKHIKPGVTTAVG